MNCFTVLNQEMLPFIFTTFQLNNSGHLMPVVMVGSDEDRDGPDSKPSFRWIMLKPTEFPEITDQMALAGCELEYSQKNFPMFSQDKGKTVEKALIKFSYVVSGGNTVYIGPEKEAQSGFKSLGFGEKFVRTLSSPTVSKCKEALFVLEQGAKIVIIENDGENRKIKEYLYTWTGESLIKKEVNKRKKLERCTPQFFEDQESSELYMDNRHIWRDGRVYKVIY